MPSSEVKKIFTSVSVIIPAYNAAVTIGRALQSVAQQNLLPVEVIVVDDGSTDGTIETTKKYAEELSPCRLTVISQPNRGAGAARNLAISKATEDYLAFLDADDEWLPDKLRLCMAEVDRAKCDFICHNVIYVTVDRKQVLLDSYTTYSRYTNPYLAGYLHGFISTPTVVVSRDRVLQAGGFDPTLKSGQDYELWLALFALEGMTVRILPEALALYHETPSGITKQIAMRTQFARRIASDHAHELARFSSHPFKLFVLRAMIIEYQVISGYWNASSYTRAIASGVLAPFRVVQTLISANSTQPRGRFLRLPK